MAIRTVEQSGGDFSSFSAAAADAGTNPGDILRTSEEWTIDDTVAVVISDDDLTLEAVKKARHPGKWDTSKNHYRLVVGGAHCINVTNQDNCVIDGLAIEQNGSGGSDEGIRMVPGFGNSGTVKNCIIRNMIGTGASQDGIYMGGDSFDEVNIEQCAIYGFPRAGINTQVNGSSVQTINVNSCSIYNNDRLSVTGSGGGINIAGNGTVTYNILNTWCIDNDNFGQDYDETGGPTSTWNITQCFDSDNSISTVIDSGSNNTANATVTASASPGAGTFVMVMDLTSGNEDLSLRDNITDNDAQDYNANNSAHGMTIPMRDIVNTVRPQKTKFDVGFFEIRTQQQNNINANLLGNLLGGFQ